MTPASSAGRQDVRCDSDSGTQHVTFAPGIDAVSSIDIESANLQRFTATDRGLPPPPVKRPGYLLVA